MLCAQYALEKKRATGILTRIVPVMRLIASPRIKQELTRARSISSRCFFYQKIKTEPGGRNSVLYCAWPWTDWSGAAGASDRVCGRVAPEDKAT
jgi:hypothetical protein